MDLLVIAQTLQKPDKRLAKAYKTMRLTHTRARTHKERKSEGKEKEWREKKDRKKMIRRFVALYNLG